MAVLELGDAEGDLESNEEDDVKIDKLVALLLADLSVDADMVVGIGMIVLGRVIADVAIDDRVKLDVVEEIVLFRFAVWVSMLVDADKDEPAGMVVYSTTVVNEVIMDLASVVSLVLRGIVRNSVVVDVIVVNVVVWLFGDLGGRVKFFQAERAYKHGTTTFVQPEPYRTLL